MKFLIKEISPSKTELRVSLSSIDVDGKSFYLLGTSNGIFDEGTIDSKYIPPTLSNYYSMGPNPGIIRLVVAYLKDVLGSVEGFKDAVLISAFENI